jgi:hypothetical protein
MSKVIQNSLLMISDDIDSRLNQCVKDDVLVFNYSKRWSYNDFVKNFVNLMETSKIQEKSLELVGWVFHGFTIDKPNPETTGKIIFNIVSDYEINLKDKSNENQLNHLVHFIIEVKKYMKTNRFDLISCCLHENPYFKHIYKYLVMHTDLQFASSVDLTGNIEGGDWILESHGINLLGTYFELDTNDILGEVSISLNNTSGCQYPF